MRIVSTTSSHSHGDRLLEKCMRKLYLLSLCPLMSVYTVVWEFAGLYVAARVASMRRARA